MLMVIKSFKHSSVSPQQNSSPADSSGWITINCKRPINNPLTMTRYVQFQPRHRFRTWTRLAKTLSSCSCSNCNIAVVFSSLSCSSSCFASLDLNLTCRIMAPRAALRTSATKPANVLETICELAINHKRQHSAN